MSAALLGYLEKRAPLSPLPDFKVQSLTSDFGGSTYETPSDIQASELTSGVYELDGQPVEVVFEGLDFGKVFTRDLNGNLLVTSHGTSSNWTVEHRNAVNLKDPITEAVRAARQSASKEALTKRQDRQLGEPIDLGDNPVQKCQVESSKYVLLEIGRYWSEYEPSSDTIACGGGFCESSAGKGIAKTWTESFNIGLAPNLKGEVVDAALNLNYGWQKSVQRSEDARCGWTSGKCHMWYVAQRLVYQRGFAIEVVPLGPLGGSLATVQFVHAEAPEETDHVECFWGCCHPKAPRPLPSFCADMNPNDRHEEWYGWCDNWDARPPGCHSP